MNVVPDISEEVEALTSLFAIQQVMDHHEVMYAEMVCATLAHLQNRMTWFFAVNKTVAGLTYSPERLV
ncbi:hypothetical protein [Dictyobacter kobayashii]|uniref:hypothetical protein n=1 Tax=Dictyobacter kobayashii TaxID=2014872 RepID=UPI000F82EFCF|nr:hypothetical protein [Dictyobacter kobayashii]